mmetsp:Transcript_195/g.517  ORF Transcript_195/g.517 Transcript_195/m.517 type:complete len:310 (+) Transcript_195:41-970(+)
MVVFDKRTQQRLCKASILSLVCCIWSVGEETATRGFTWLPNLDVSVRRQLQALPAVVRHATDEEAKEDAPMPPESPDMMVRQAAATVIRAYRAGLPRQSVRLNLDLVCEPEVVWEGGIETLLEATLPVVQNFTEQLKIPGGADMKEVRVSAIDEIGMSSGDVGTLLYRISEQSWQDAAVLYLTGRTFAVDAKSTTFLDGMRDRLVVLLNSEDAASSFRIENQGSECELGGQMGNLVPKLKNFCYTFRVESYYYRTLSWTGLPKAILFRAFPHPWQAFVYREDGRLVKVADFERKPAGDTVRQYVAESLS